MLKQAVLQVQAQKLDVPAVELAIERSFYPGAENAA
jgi:hypothetical protein